MNFNDQTVEQQQAAIADLYSGIARVGILQRTSAELATQIGDVQNLAAQMSGLNDAPLGNLAMQARDACDAWNSALNEWKSMLGRVSILQSQGADMGQIEIALRDANAQGARAQGFQSRAVLLLGEASKLASAQGSPVASEVSQAAAAGAASVQQAAVIAKHFEEPAMAAPPAVTAEIKRSASSAASSAARLDHPDAPTIRDHSDVVHQTLTAADDIALGVGAQTKSLPSKVIGYGLGALLLLALKR